MYKKLDTFKQIQQSQVDIFVKKSLHNETSCFKPKEIHPMNK